jgi:hypothetical protein
MKIRMGRGSAGERVSVWYQFCAGIGIWARAPSRVACRPAPLGARQRGRNGVFRVIHVTFPARYPELGGLALSLVAGGRAGRVRSVQEEFFRVGFAR